VAIHVHKREDCVDLRHQVRNLGDGFDDEECPERESWRWEMRSTRAPGTGWREDGEVLLKHYIEGDRQEARSSDLREGPVHFV